MAGNWGKQKSALDSLELELQMVVSCLIGAGMEPGFSERVASALKNWVISLAIDNYYFHGYLLPQLWFSPIIFLG